MQHIEDYQRALVVITNQIKKLSATTMYIGDYKWSCIQSDFDGWMVCDGRGVSQTQYAALYKLIGTKFTPVGVVLAAGTFMLPDGRGNVVGSVSSSYPLGSMAGSQTHVITASEMPVHNHTGTTNTDGIHSHAITDPGHSHVQTTMTSGSTGNQGTPLGCADSTQAKQTGVANISSSTTGVTVSNSAGHTHVFTTNNAGGNTAMNMMQPTLFGGTLFIFAGR